MYATPIPRAKPLGKLNGKPVHRFTVVAVQSGLDRDLWRNEERIEVIARTPTEAVNLVRDEIAHKVEHPTEVETRGPLGGTVSRFIGYESMVWAGMSHLERNQLEFGI